MGKIKRSKAGASALNPQKSYPSPNPHLRGKKVFHASEASLFWFPKFSSAVPWVKPRLNIRDLKIVENIRSSSGSSRHKPSESNKASRGGPVIPIFFSDREDSERLTILTPKPHCHWANTTASYHSLRRGCPNKRKGLSTKSGHHQLFNLHKKHVAKPDT